MNARVPSREELRAAIAALLSAEAASNLSYARVFTLLEATFVRKLDDLREVVDELVAQELMQHELTTEDTIQDLEEVGDCLQWLKVQSCTSQHPLHGPERMLQSQGMWVTTGLLPQKLVLEFRLPCALTELVVHTRFVSELVATVKFPDSRGPKDYVAERRAHSPSCQFDEHCIRFGGDIVAAVALTITAGTAPFCIMRAVAAQGVCIQPETLLRLYRSQPITQ